MDKAYWDEYYRNKSAVTYPSPFAEHCLERYLSPGARIVELGSGSGRDAFYFAENGHEVWGLDQSVEAVTECNRRAEDTNESVRVAFQVADFTKLRDLSLTADVMYSRFTMHSVDDDAQAAILAEARDVLEPGGLFLLEARTTLDALYGKGKQVGEHAFVTDHYRRHIDAQALLHQVLALGYTVREFVESAGLAEFRGEDPVVVRLAMTTPTPNEG